MVAHVCRASNVGIAMSGDRISTNKASSVSEDQRPGVFVQHIYLLKYITRV